MSIEAYDYGYQDGVAAERQRVREWVEKNRRRFEIEDNVYIYRDGFQSEDLLRFLDGDSDTNNEREE